LGSLGIIGFAPFFYMIKKEQAAYRQGCVAREIPKVAASSPTKVGQGCVPAPLRIAARPIGRRISSLIMNKTTLIENKNVFYQWLVGFTDGDGTFSISISNNKITFIYQISQSTYNLRVLNFIKSQLGVGGISIEKKRSMAYFRITDRKYLESLIMPIFDKYPLLTSKQFNYIKFKQAFLKAQQTNLSTLDKINIIKEDICKNCPEDYISPAWALVDFKVTNFESGSKVMNKP